MSCSICKYDDCQAVMQLYDDRYGYPTQFSLIKCPSCRHAALNCKLTPTELIGLYTNYYPRKSLDIESYRAHVEQMGFIAWFNGLRSSAFRWVPKNVRILDIGCGFGQSLGYHLARGCDVYGVEADENIHRVVDRYGFKVHVGLFDDSNYESSFFDYVTMDQVIEHVTEPILVLKGVARILKSGGTLVLSTPNANGWGAKLFGARWINWHAPYHLQFLSKQSIQLAATQAGFVLEEVRTITNSEWLYYQWIHLVTYPELGETSSFWSPYKGELTILQKLGIRLLPLIHKTKINHLITRVFDAIGFGDNFIFILKKS